MRHSSSLCASILLLIASSGYAADISTVARTGQLAASPGLEEFRRFLVDNINDPLPDPVINENSACLFLASLRGPGATASTDKAVFLRGPAAARVVARKYYPIPGATDVVFSEFSSVGLGRLHDSVVLFTILGGSGVTPGVDNAGVLNTTWASSQMLARMGDAAPDALPAANYTGFLEPVMPASSATPLVPARVRLTGSGIYADGVWMPGMPNAARIQQYGAAPGTSGATFVSFETQSDCAGPATYRGTLTGGDVSSVTVNGTIITNATGLWVDQAASGGAPVLVARTAQPLTANPMGPVLSAISGGSIAPATTIAGAVAFAGSIVDRQTGAALGIGVWEWSGGTRTQRFVTGTPIAGESGLTVSAFSGVSSGRILFAADDGSVWAMTSLAGNGVTSYNNYALIHASATGVVSMCARGGSQAPGCPAGQTLTNAALGGVLRASASAGKLAFTAGLQGQGVNGANDTVVLLADATGTRLCLREQDQIGAMKIVEFTSGAADLQVNDRGQIIVRCDLSWVGDTSGNRYNGIVAWTPDAGASIVAVASQPLSLVDGTSGPVLTLKLSRKQALNNAGLVVFAAALSSSSGEDQGVFKASLGSGQPPCTADYDLSGLLTVSDIFAFLTDWFRGEADFDGSGVTEVVDIFAFLTAWFAGCP